MYKVRVNGDKEFQVELNSATGTGTVNEQPFDLNLLKVKEGIFHILKGHTGYNVEVQKMNPEEKTFVIRVNGRKYNIEVKDKYDELLKSMGLDALAGAKVNELKAPMPGLVLNVLAEAGAEVKKGEPLLVLEAMKMENVLKSPADGVIKKVCVNNKQAVEKNQILIQFQ